MPRIPVPVQSLQYSDSVSPTKPGIVTAIGVACIVVACLSAVASIFSSLAGLGWLIDSNGQTTTAKTPTPLHIHSAPLALLIGDGVGSILLDVLLIIAGILTLTSSPIAPSLLRAYAWIKILLAIVAGLALGWIGVELWNSQVGGSPGSVTDTSIGFVAGGVIIFALGLSFPVGVLIALRSRASREFYRTITQ